VHIVGVVVESFIHKENLVKAMWHGYKKPAGK
jgi:cytochrome b